MFLHALLREGAYETLTEDDRRQLSAQLAALSEELSRVPGALGLE